jgi:tRNA(Ile)-lysidine synthase
MSIDSPQQGILQALDAALADSATPIYVGFSGGMDSTVLAHALSEWRQRKNTGVSIVLIHIDHGLHADSASWAVHCAAIAKALALPIIVQQVQVERQHGSIESAARRARMSAFQALVPSDARLLLAHHADDQSETIMMKILRGDGLRGMTAMRASRQFGNLQILRPLLNIPRALIQAYAQARDLRWIEDPANQNLAYTRNRVRHELMPVLQGIAPNLHTQLQRIRDQADADRSLLEAIAKRELAMCLALDDRQLHLPPLQQMSAALQHWVLRAWLMQLGLFDSSALQRLLHLAKSTNCDEQISRAGQADLVAGWIAYRYQETLYLQAPERLPPAGWHTQWNGADALDLPGDLGQLRFSSPVVNANFTIGIREGGERIQLAGRSHRHELKNLLNQLKIPPHVRKRLILLRFSGQTELACVVGIAQSEAFAALLSAQQTRLVHNQAAN